MVHVALRGHRGQRVDLPLELEHVERRDAEDLGLTALEERGAVDARDDVDLGRERTDVLEPTTVDADLLGEDALAHDLLRQRVESRRDLLLTALEALSELVEELSEELFARGFALLLVGDLEVLGLLRLGEVLDGLEDVVLVVAEDGELDGRLRGEVGELLLGAAEFGDEGLCGLEPLGHDLFGGGLGPGLDEVEGLVGGLGLDHHDGDVVTDHATGDDHVEDGVVEPREVRERDPLAVDEGDADTADGAGERQTRELGRHRGGVDGQGVVDVVGVDRHHGDDDLDLVAQALDEGRARRAVDEAAGEDRIGRGTALAAEERAGDAAGGVHALFDVDGEREEVEALAGFLPAVVAESKHGVVVEIGDGGAGGLLGQATGLEADGVRAEATVVDRCDRGFRGGSHVISLFGAESGRRVLALSADSVEDAMESGPVIDRGPRKIPSGGHYRGPKRPWASAGQSTADADDGQ